MDSLLVEIGTEEIPAGYIKPALEAFRTTLVKRLENQRIDHGDANIFGTPRKLTVEVKDVAPKQRSETLELIGPPEKVAFDDSGNPTMAAERFAQKVGISIKKLKVKDTPKGRYLFVKKMERGLSTRNLLKDILPEVILSLPFPKTMKWGDLHITFARPIHSILALLGKQLVSFTLGNIKSGRYTAGHSFMSPKKIKISHPDEYLESLKSAEVIVDINERQKAVEKDISQAAKNIGGKIVNDPELLDIVTNLVERPASIVGKFDNEYLRLPDEILITAMREHQKYFAVADEKGDLMPCFIAVNNTLTKDMKLVATGHERVIRARLADAQFFYNSDVKKTMYDWAEKLKGVLFQAKLGTVHAKSKRVEKIAIFLADEALKKTEIKQDTPELKSYVATASLLAKADLVSQVVVEFPKLQGVMGRVYALEKGEPKQVAMAIEDHYKPSYSGGPLPEGITGALVSIADKIDSISGCFTIGLIPTGASDPHALRRQGIGIILIMRKNDLSLSLKSLIEKSLSLYEKEGHNPEQDTAEKIYTFLQNRMAHLLAEEGYSKDVISAVTSVSVDNVPDVFKRVDALEKMKNAPDFEPLAIAFKRVVNIIKKTDYDSNQPIDVGLFEHSSEENLYNAIKEVENVVLSNLDKGDYKTALKTIASLRDAVDAFFDGVMVMTDDKKIRNNRLLLLSLISKLFSRFADFSKISV